MAGNLKRIFGCPTIKKTALQLQKGEILWKPSDSQSIVLGSCLENEDIHPILVQGESKSGKSLACLEIICQLLIRKEKEKILILNPSNSKLDMFYQRLKGCKSLESKNILRIHSTFRKADEIDWNYIKKTDPQFQRSDQGVFLCPNLEQMQKADVILITPSCAWYLLSRG